MTLLELHNLGWLALYLIPICVFFAVLEALFPNSKGGR